MHRPVVIMIYHSPAEYHLGQQALSFIRQRLTEQQPVAQVFFYGPGTLYGNCYLNGPAGQEDLQQAWQQLAQEQQLNLVLCGTAGAQYGIEPTKPPAGNLATGFTVGGLTEFAEALDPAVELVQF